MASSLIELGQKIPKQAPKQEVQREPAGDEIMARAQGLAKVNDEDLAHGKLFYESSELVKAKLAADDAYAASVLPGLKEAQGKSQEDYYEAIINEADKLKIERLSQENPEWFGEGRAAIGGFLNSATFGQLSRITGKVKEMVNGVPYEQVVEQEAEKIRLLEKAFPKSFVGGEVASFLIPGSPVKTLFSKSLQLGAKAASKASAKALFQKISKNPQYLQKIAQGVLGGATGEGARQGIEGTLGTDLQSISFDRGVESSLSGAVTGGTMAALIPLAASGTVKAAKKIAPNVNKNLGRVVESLTGTNEKALRAFAKNPEAIKSASGTQSEIGDDLVDFLVTQKKSGVTEVKLADELLDQLPDVDPSPLIKHLRSFKKGNDPKLDGQVKLLGEWADRIESMLPISKESQVALSDYKGALSAGLSKIDREFAGKLEKVTESIARKKGIINSTLDIRARAASGELPGGEKSLPKSLVEQAQKRLKSLDIELESAIKSLESEKAARLAQYERSLPRPSLTVSKISARAMRGLVDDLQNAADDAFGKESDLYMTALKGGSRRARMQIVDAAAKEGGEVGKAYNELMGKAAQKVEILKFIGRRLGNSEEVQRQRAEGFVSNLFGKNKSAMQQRMADLDSKFGTNFTDLAENASLAEKLGPSGAPELISASQTGRSLLGSAVGFVAGSVLPGVGPQAGAAAGAIASSPRVGSVILGASDKISGFIQKLNSNPVILEQMASGRGAKMPADVVQLSKELYKTLKKDGPISMGSSMRLIADTPFFVGLVHYADVIDRKMQANQGVKAVKAKSQSETAYKE